MKSPTDAWEHSCTHPQAADFADGIEACMAALPTEDGYRVNREFLVELVTYLRFVSGQPT